MALVCEGGGQRGIFTAGVLDEFQRAGFNPFDLLIGTSAGAQNLSAYICGQMGYARRVITRYTTSAQFFNPLRFVRGGHLIDLDWLVDTAAAQMPLAMDVAEQHFIDGREFLLCACRSDDFEPAYLPAQRERWLPAIKASSAIPGFYRQGVELDGVSYQDGGISDAIPVEEAYRRGADTIVVIRTVPSQMYYTPQWMKRMEHWLSDSSLQQMVRILQHHEQSYHRIQRFIEKPPGKLRIFEIFPPKPLASNALGSRLGALNQDYHPGAAAAATSRHRRPVDGAAGTGRYQGAKIVVAPPYPAGERQNAFADRDRHRHVARSHGAAGGCGGGAENHPAGRSAAG